MCRSSSSRWAVETDNGQRELVNENGDKFPRQREYPIDIERFHKTKGQMVEQLRIL